MTTVHDVTHIIGIDPGKNTGITFYSPETRLHESYELDAGAKGKPSSIVVAEEIAQYLTIYSDTVHLIVCEDWEFRHTKHSVNAKHACGPIGALEYLCEQENIPLALAKPMLRSRITDDVLKSSGLWWPHGAGHARQAMKHVLAYLLRTGHKPTQEMLYPRD